MGGDVRVKDYLNEVKLALAALLVGLAAVALLGVGAGLPIWLLTAHFSGTVAAALSVVWVFLYTAAVAPLFVRLLEWRP